MTEQRHRDVNPDYLIFLKNLGYFENCIFYLYDCMRRQSHPKAQKVVANFQLIQTLRRMSVYHLLISEKGYLDR